MFKKIIRTSIFSFAEAAKGIKNNKVISLLTIGTISAAMSFMGLFPLIFVNMEGVFDLLNSRSEIIVYVKSSASKKTIETLKSKIMKKKETNKLRYISRKEALEDFKDIFKIEQSVLNTLKGNPIPASFILTVKNEFKEPGLMNKTAKWLTNLPGVEDVEYGKEWIDRIEAFLSFIRLFMITIGALIVSGLIFIISNSVRLSIYSRAEEISVMKLVGASPRFIKWPFIIEGMIHGFMGGLFSIFFLYIGYIIFIKNISDPIKIILGMNNIVFLPARVIAALLFTGAGIGLLASQISLHNLIKFRE